MDKIKKDIRKFALLNGSKFDYVNPGSVISALIAEHPSIKKNMKEVQTMMKPIINEINKMSKDERLQELKDVAPELLEEKKVEKREGLKDLPNVKRAVVVRIAPSPSGPLHIGHSYITGLNYQYKQQYKGKLILRIEDTNADNIDPDAYSMIPEDANWLTENGIDSIIIQSDRMDLYYGYILRLIEENHAYVCTCETEVFKEKLSKSTPCMCRNLSVDEQLKRWGKMLCGYDEGEAVLRFKSDIHHKNPAMRDFPLARINLSEHPRKGEEYRVWPLMNLAVAIDDMEMGVTHAIRGKDHADNALRQEMIHKVLKVDTPESVSVGRINFEGFDLSTTQTKLKIKEGEYDGWDDIRLPFLQSFKRRGYQPGALRKFAVSLGVTQTDKTVSQEEFMKSLNYFNKEIIDPVANRYFCVRNPVVITIKNAPELEIEQDLHPDNKKGGRKFKTNQNFYIEKDDYDQLQNGQLVRLMGCLNFRVIKKTPKENMFEFDSKEYGIFRDDASKDKKQIHWLPQDQSQLTKIKIKLEDNTDVDCFAEKGVENVKVNNVVQFERFGFCRCDSKNSFWYGHR